MFLSQSFVEPKKIFAETQKFCILLKSRTVNKIIKNPIRIKKMLVKILIKIKHKLIPLNECRSLS